MVTPAPKLPSDVVVAGRVWRIEFVDGILYDRDEHGNANQRTGIIELDPLGAQPRTLIHELMHAAEDTIEAEISHDAIAALAAGLADALISRPVLAEWIAARVRGDA